MKTLIIGYGEIGKGIEELYSRSFGRHLIPQVHDPKEGKVVGDTAGPGPYRPDVVHVCVPSNKVEEVIASIPSRSTPLIILHSTVVPGTCRVLAESYGVRLVHAPIRGMHPELAESIKTFLLALGGLVVDVLAAREVFRMLNVKTRIYGEWETTELAKIMSTTRYGMEILFMREMWELCRQFGADFDMAYTMWTHDYNDGYEKMNQSHFKRPILKPVPGVIGGHCILPNARLMSEHSWAAEYLEHHGQKDFRKEENDDEVSPAPWPS